MLFNNVFSGLSQVAKSVLGLFEKEERQPISYFEHDKPLAVAPTVEPLIVTKEALEEWKDYNWKHNDECRVKISSFGRVRYEWILSDGSAEWKEPRCYWKESERHYGCNVRRNDGPGTRPINIAIAVLDTFAGRPEYLNTNRSRCARFFVMLDGDPLNCRLDNLRWITEREIEEYLVDRANKSNARRAEAKAKRKAEAEQLAATAEQSEHERRIDKVLDGVGKTVAIKAVEVQKPKQTVEVTKVTHIDFNKAMREEIWVPIPKYEDTYEISSFGNVRSVTRFVTRHRSKMVKGVEEKVAYNFPIQGRKLKPYMEDGALVINLTRGGKQARFSIAKLVMLIFAKDKLTSTNFQVIHLNGNTNNCRLNNLRIVDEVQAA